MIYLIINPMKSLNLFFVIVALLLLTSCSGPYTFKDNGKTITVSEDDVFEIKLDGKSESDAVWKFAEDPKFVKIKESKTNFLTGNTIEYTFLLQSISAGIDHLQLIYTDGNTITDHFELTVIVGTVGVIETE